MNGRIVRDGDFASIIVARVMATDVLTAKEDERVAAVVGRMSQRNVGCAVVTDQGGAVAGMFTERDLIRRVVGPGLDPAATPMGNVMTRGVIAASADLTLALASELFEKRGFRHIPVVSTGALVGILSMRDLFRVRLRHVESLLDREVASLREMRSLIEMGADERLATLIDVNKRLEKLALTDELTGLFNYRYFMHRLGQETARVQRTGQPLCLLFIDIDHFKRVNDMHGHAVGDQVLRHISALLRTEVEGDAIVAHLRKSDVVARYGGEEFAVLLPDSGPGGGIKMAERVRAAMEESPFQLSSGRTVPVTISVGVAAIPDHTREAEKLVAAADAALYAAKAEGRNRVRTASN